MVTIERRIVFTPKEKEDLKKFLDGTAQLSNIIGRIENAKNTDKLLEALDAAISNIDKIRSLRTPLFEALLEVKKEKKEKKEKK